MLKKSLRLTPMALLLLAPLANAQEPALEITGASDRLADNIRAYVNIADESCQAGQWRLRALARTLDDNIADAGRALGYYHLHAEKNFTRSDDCWRLTLAVTPGEPTRLKVVNITLDGEGREDAQLAKIAGNSGLAVGDQLNHGRYGSFKSRLLQTASTRGYFDAEYVTSEVLVAANDKSARINMLLDTGPRYRLGDIQLNHDILGRPLLDRYLTRFEEGQYYQASDLQQLRSEFRASGYFEGVRVVPDLENLQDNQVPIVIDLNGGPRHSYSAGAGYATDTGPRVLLGYQNRYLNSRGHTFDADVNVAETITTYQVSYGIPMERPAYDKLKLYTGFGREKLNNWQSDRLATGINYSTWQAGNFLNTYDLAAEREDYRFGDDPSRRSELIIPMFTTSITRGPESNYPTSGWSLMARLKGASEELGSSTDFAQAYGRIKYIQKLGGGRLLLRVDGGITEVDDFAALPISLRF
ncbi:MAG TPA: POTRA domain-containing protein, partial [Marinobacter sp.]|nr:POTRA domain-containing protein [Marinobacter sp.]